MVRDGIWKGRRCRGVEVKWTGPRWNRRGRVWVSGILGWLFCRCRVSNRTAIAKLGVGICLTILTIKGLKIDCRKRQGKRLDCWQMACGRNSLILGWLEATSNLHLSVTSMSSLLFKIAALFISYLISESTHRVSKKVFQLVHR